MTRFLRISTECIYISMLLFVEGLMAFLDDRWNDMYVAYKLYSEQVGGCINVKNDDIDQMGRKVGQWQQIQRGAVNSMPFAA